MNTPKRILSEKPLKAETAVADLQSWITSNTVFFKRNQEIFMSSPVVLESWRLSIQSLVKKTTEISFADILSIPKVEVANTLECSGNSRPLLKEKASIGGVGKAIWGGIRLADVLQKAGIASEARYVAFEGLDNPVVSGTIRFIRSLPLGKAMDSTILAYEMNGEPLPLEHGYPLRALALSWTGANCVKWLGKISLLEQPVSGYFMDNVCHEFQKGETPESGKVVTSLPLKSIITSPETGSIHNRGFIVVRGAAYAGEVDLKCVEVSVDDGTTWHAAEFIGPHERYAWHRWEYTWIVSERGAYNILARATDRSGQIQPMTADWNVLGYGNNGSREHVITIEIQ